MNTFEQNNKIKTPESVNKTKPLFVLQITFGAMTQKNLIFWRLRKYFFSIRMNSNFVTECSECSQREKNSCSPQSSHRLTRTRPVTNAEYQAFREARSSERRSWSLLLFIGNLAWAHSFFEIEDNTYLLIVLHALFSLLLVYDKRTNYHKNWVIL